MTAAVVTQVEDERVDLAERAQRRRRFRAADLHLREHVELDVADVAVEPLGLLEPAVDALELLAKSGLVLSVGSSSRSGATIGMKSTRRCRS
jgi:hypothetical protein